MNTELKNGMYVYTDFVPEDINCLTVGKLYPVSGVSNLEKGNFYFESTTDKDRPFASNLIYPVCLKGRSWKIATPEMVEAYFAGKKEVETIEQAAEKYISNFQFDIAHPKRAVKRAYINGAQSDAAIKSKAAKNYWYEQF